MQHPIDLEARKSVWIALSDFYLDTEMQDYTFQHIARTIRASPYSLGEARQINQYEVFPVLYSNLLSVAGVWGGFNETWLIGEITASLNKRGRFRSLRNRITYALHQWMIQEAWKELERTYHALRPGTVS